MKPLLILLLTSSLLLTACGAKSSPTAPAPPQPAQVAGTWSGILASSNFQALAVVVQLTQTGSNVTGSWATPNDWNGTITGSVDTSSFAGTFTLSAPNALGVGQRCTGTASVSGPASNGSTLRWTSPGFTGSCTGEPLSLVWTIQR